MIMIIIITIIIMRGFLYGRMPQRIPSLEYKSFTKSCYLPWFTRTEKVADEK